MTVSRLKTTYQKNMLIGQSVSVLIMLFICLIFCDLGSVYNSIRGIIITPVIIETPDKQKSHVNIPRKTLVGGRTPEMKSGFLGFDVNFKIIPEASTRNLSIPSPTVYLPDRPVIQPDSVSFSPIEGDLMGEFYADGYDYIFRHEKRAESLERDVIVLEKTDPEYPFVAQERGVEGEVIVLVYIDSNGKLSSFPVESDNGGVQTLEYYVVREFPGDWFFAQNLIEVLPQWKFGPRLENGDPTGGFLKIKYSYVLKSGE